MLYTDESKEGLTGFKAIRKVHEVHIHKSSDLLVLAYRNARLMVGI